MIGRVRTDDQQGDRAMDEIVEALRAEQAALAAMVDPLDRGGLARPSRCPGWSVADVLLHLAQTNEIAVASVEATTRFTETWIHTGDVAQGLGIAHEPTGRIRHIVRLAHRTLPYAFATAGRELGGPIRFELRSPSGEQWTFGDEPSTTVIRGPAVELCEVAGQRRDATDTQLTGEGPDAAAVLALVRTFA